MAGYILLPFYFYKVISSFVSSLVLLYAILAEDFVFLAKFYKMDILISRKNSKDF
jgi:hypothetical protein